ncbi:ABC transporter ATP-binding protein [Helicobacter pylori CPY6311]|nr:ABC transporter ATP-binding protein [Helicobacter pylori CPY6311]
MIDLRRHEIVSERSKTKERYHKQSDNFKKDRETQNPLTPY